jgi:hypothetical protein
LSAKTPAEKLALELAQEKFKTDKDKEKYSGGLDSVLGKIITGGMVVGAAQRLISGVGQLSQTQNGIDLIKPTEELKYGGLGAIVGAVGGAIVGGLLTGGLGALEGAQLGATTLGAIGTAYGGFEGGVNERQAFAKMAYIDAENRYRATTGGNEESTAVGSNSIFGLSKQQLLESTREYARLSGSSSNANKNALDAYFANKGYGVDIGTSNSLVELQRYSRDNNKDLANLLGGIIQKGQNGAFRNGDNSFLNEYVQKFVSLNKELLKSANSVASGTTIDILNKFNAIGGQFTTTDPRSSQLVSTINSSLAGGGNSDFAKAGNFLALKQSNPNMSLIDLLIEEQKGLGSEKYLSSVLKQVRGAGGGRSQQILNIADRFGLTNNYAAAESIYNNQDSLINGKMSMSDISVKTDLSGKAKDFTTLTQKTGAEISDAMLTTFEGGIEKMIQVWKESLQSVIDGIKIKTLPNGTSYIAFDPATARTAAQQRVNNEKAISQKRGEMLMHLDH